MMKNLIEARVTLQVHDDMDDEAKKVIGRKMWAYAKSLVENEDGLLEVVAATVVDHGQHPDAGNLVEYDPETGSYGTYTIEGDPSVSLIEQGDG